MFYHGKISVCIITEIPVTTEYNGSVVCLHKFVLQVNFRMADAHSSTYLLLEPYRDTVFTNKIFFLPVLCRKKKFPIIFPNIIKYL